MDPKETKRRWKELKLLLGIDGHMPAVVQMANGSILHGEAAHEVICEWYNAAYQHPSTLWPEEWDILKRGLEGDVRYALKDLPRCRAQLFKIQWMCAWA